nr:MAG TPA: hypothetical protein [Caudoviricetes sp.]DAH98741.1 MAG TPA: hypothetical protein [Caudoviricetes sp.]DAN88385.1 MAG TPA: hypothetical protein [Caudoviricetes sp.]DAP28017.1 MAG TPA: hypothetical protein [Caudoviricetes sp.]DAR02993.1 MAG TPA: hypothetical protein [Caudoviricetes sp.]
MLYPISPPYVFQDGTARGECCWFNFIIKC